MFYVVSTTGTDLVPISERAADVEGVSRAGKMHVYEYRRLPQP